MGTAVEIPKAWRSEAGLVGWFFLLCVLSYRASTLLPGSVVSGPVVGVGGYDLVLSLPVFWLLPAGVLLYGLVRIYDVRYVVDAVGIETRVGILGLNQKIVRIRYEDIRSVEVKQTLLGRLLDFGTIEIGTAATRDVEIYLSGVGRPYTVQEAIQNERDVRQRRRSLSAPDGPATPDEGVA